MSDIKFTREEKAAMVARLQRYFSEELQQTLGCFDAEFLLDFFAEEMGAHFYNRGLHDAQALLSKQLDDVNDAIYQLERPIEFLR